MSRRAGRGRGRRLYAAAGLTTVYLALAVLGLQWATLSGTASPVFPAAGVALAGLALGGVRLWPAVFIGRWAASLIAGASLPFWAPLAVAAGNALAAVLGAQALRWAGFDPGLRRLRDVSILAAAALGSSAVSATIGSVVLTQALDQGSMNVEVAWQNWWTGDAVGVLLVTPLVLSWARGEPISRDRSWWLHLVLSTIFATGATWLLFGPTDSPLLRTFLIFPALVWAALAGGVRGSSVVMVPVAAIAVWATTQGAGPFAVASTVLSSEARFLLVQQFVGLTVVSTLVLAVIADERRGKRALRQSEASFRSFFETPAVGVVQAEITSARLLRVNQRFCQITGYTREELAEMTFLELAHLDDRTAIWESFLAALRSESAHYMTEKRLIRKGGDVVWVRVNAGVVSDPDGTVTQATVVVEDITEQKRAEEELRVQSQITETIISNAAEALFLMDPQGLATYANPAAEEMFGWSMQDLAGTKLHDSIHAKHPDGSPYRIHECPLGQSFAAGRVIRNHEDLFVRRDGSFVPVLCSMAPIHHDGVVSGAVLTVSDITERKRAEDAIRASEERRLQTERAARAEAERASRLKDEFLATISHELRTPLNAIAGWSQILNRSEVDRETTVRGLSAIERNARAQAHLIDDLLDMSRIVSGKIHLDVQGVDLQDLIAAAVDTIRPAADAKGIQIHQALDPRAGPVRGDANRLQQVIWNLLSNAVKFTPNGGRVQVDLQRADDLVRVTVADTGQGIEPDFLPFVYDRFRQADGSTTRQHGGLGLGLAIVKQLVELHGGRVRAESPGNGQGATFTVELPLAATPASSTISSR